ASHIGREAPSGAHSLTKARAATTTTTAALRSADVASVTRAATYAAATTTTHVLLGGLESGLECRSCAGNV
ncbi:hypothetical protein, partial [Pseudomonas helleri]|uniref:hypothetical protein n=1 Tax=Pseudomonas helleri TaxID=1608996 RepID=UPI001885FC17